MLSTVSFWDIDVLAVVRHRTQVVRLGTQRVRLRINVVIDESGLDSTSPASDRYRDQRVRLGTQRVRLRINVVIDESGFGFNESDLGSSESDLGFNESGFGSASWPASPTWDSTSPTLGQHRGSSNPTRSVPPFLRQSRSSGRSRTEDLMLNCILND